MYLEALVRFQTTQIKTLLWGRSKHILLEIKMYHAEVPHSKQKFTKPEL